MITKHLVAGFIIRCVIAGTVAYWLFVLLNGCSTMADRLDDRPSMCRDLGKRGGEC